MRSRSAGSLGRVPDASWGFGIQPRGSRVYVGSPSVAPGAHLQPWGRPTASWGSAPLRKIGRVVVHSTAYSFKGLVGIGLSLRLGGRSGHEGMNPASVPTHCVHKSVGDWSQRIGDAGNRGKCAGHLPSESYFDLREKS